MAKERTKSRQDERFGGYITSFLAFAVITALWAFIVRDDAFYGATPVFGVLLPATTIAYLATMPLIGFIAGKWPYEAPATSFGLGKAIARGLNFVYSHLLIVLFTAAMVIQAFFGWNVDAAVREIDDRLFDIASRFAPWLAAYLAGFNLGRAVGLNGAREREAAEEKAAKRGIFFSEKESAAGRREPTLGEGDAERPPASKTEPGRFAFKRDPALFDAKGRRRDPATKASAENAPAPKARSAKKAPASKPSALFAPTDGVSPDLADMHAPSFERLR